MQDLIQIRLIKQALVRLLPQDLDYQSDYGHKTWKDSNLPRCASAHKVT